MQADRQEAHRGEAEKMPLARSNIGRPAVDQGACRDRADLVKNVPQRHGGRLSEICEVGGPISVNAREDCFAQVAVVNRIASEPVNRGRGIKWAGEGQFGRD